MPIDAPDIKVVPRRAYAMWLMVVGSVLISFTGLVIRNMEAFMSAVAPRVAAAAGQPSQA